MERMIKNNIVLAALLVFVVQSMAQSTKYQWQSSLQGLRGEGYYKLLLSPDVRALAAGNGADFRLVDSAGNYVPYLLRTETPVSQAADLTLLPITTQSDAKSETILIENTHGVQLSGLVLTLRNKAQSTQAQLTGSDDGLHWFDISSDILFSPSSEMHADTFDQPISFPPVKYSKLRLTIKANKTIPLNIIKAAVLKPFLINGIYSPIPAPTISQRDSAKKTYVTLDYKELYTIDRLTLTLTGPRLYHRYVDIYSRDTSKWSSTGSGTFSSAAGNELAINVRTKHLLIVISNEDNQPLQVQSASGVQLNTYLLSYLDGDRNYYLVFGNPKAEKPKYDITYFEDSLKKNELHEIACGAISANKIIPNSEPAKKAATGGMNKWWIWPVLISVLVLLLFFTLSVMKDINNKT